MDFNLINGSSFPKATEGEFGSPGWSRAEYGDTRWTLGSSNAVYANKHTQTRARIRIPEPGYLRVRGGRLLRRRGLLALPPDSEDFNVDPFHLLIINNAAASIRS